MKKLATFTLILLFLFIQPVHSKQKEDVHKLNTVKYMNIEWWEKFNDPLLVEYLNKVFKNNHDLKIAELKIKENEQIAKQVFANELPNVYFNPNIERVLSSSEQHFGENMVIPDYSQTNLLFPIKASYEIDIWGKNHNITKSYKKNIEISELNRRKAYISISSEFAAAYYNLIKCDKLLALQNILLANQKELLRLANIKFEAGKASVDEVIYEQKRLKKLEEEQNILTKEREMLQDELIVLIADDNIKKIDDLSRSEIVNIQVPNAISSEIIENRPDYLASVLNLEKMGLEVRAAKKNLLPRFFIFGQFGFNGYHLNQLFGADNLLASIGVMPAIDIFTGGRKLAHLRFKKYQYDEALEFYKQTVLNSYKEVNDTLVSAKISDKNLASTKERYELEGKNLHIANCRYSVGKINKIELLSAEQRELEMHKALIASEVTNIIATLGLYKSIGGCDFSNYVEKI